MESLVFSKQDLVSLVLPRWDKKASQGGANGPPGVLVILDIAFPRARKIVCAKRGDMVRSLVSCHAQHVSYASRK